MVRVATAALLFAPAAAAEAPDALAAVPVVDLSADLETSSAIVAEALRRFGFFYLENHNIPQSCIDAQFEQSRRLFELPAAVKRAMPFNSTIDIGYMEAGYQSLDEEAAIGDTKEAFMLTNNGVFDPEFVVDKADPLAGADLWLPPKEWLPEYEPSIRAYAREATRVNHELNRLLFHSLGLGEDVRRKLTTQPFTVVKQMKYAPAAQLVGVHEQALGAGAHADWGTLTLLAVDGTPGLQVLTPEGEWLDVPPREGALIVNAGDQIDHWTNGHYRSATHRVLTRSARHRYSTAFFTYFDLYAWVSALPQFGPGVRPNETTLEYFHFKLHESIDAAGGGPVNQTCADGEAKA